jgi:cold shock protein
MNTGKVKYFDETKGFGFIKEDNSGTEVFVHVTGLVDKIAADDRVQYEVASGRKGPNAVNVKLV